MMKLSLIAASLVVAASASALAHDFRDRLDDRRASQTKRIEDGRRSGAITWTEGLRLRREQARIAAAERAFLADDGRIDRHEFQQLKQMQDAAAQHIREEAHDGRARPSWLPRIGR